jgi:hypothetical protein
LGTSIIWPKDEKQQIKQETLKISVDLISQVRNNVKVWPDMMEEKGKDIF